MLVIKRRGIQTCRSVEYSHRKVIKAQIMPSPPTHDKTDCSIDSVSILSTLVMLLIPVTCLQTLLGVLLDTCAHRAYFWVLLITQIENA